MFSVQSAQLRCSKVIPCSNCVDRGLQRQCHREEVILTGGGNQASNSGSRRRARSRSRHLSPICDAASPTTPDSLAMTHTVRSAVKVSASTTSPAASVSLLQQPLRSGFDVHESESCLSPPQSTVSPPLPSSQTQASDLELAMEAAMSLERLAWGPYRDGEQQQAAAGLTPRVCAIVEQLHQLIGGQAAREALRFHQGAVAWMHNILYMPFFVRRCEAYLGGRLHQDVAWISLYAATLCTSVYYMSPAHHTAIGLVDGYGIARKLYAITLELLKESDFIAVQSIHSIQAICILVLCAHSFGDGKRIRALLGFATTIAQNAPHKLHLQPASPPPSPSRSLPFERLVDIQVRRRIWSFLATQDWYVISSKSSYSVFPAHGTAPPPANCREDLSDATACGTFADLPLAVATQSTYTICLNRLAGQFRVLHDRLCAATSESEFDAVLQTDSDSERLLSDMVNTAMSLPPGHVTDASTQDNNNNNDTNSQAALTPAVCNSAMRRALAIAAWHHRLVNHRSFFCRSFQHKRYHYSRFVSLAAARAILRCFLSPPVTPSPFPSSCSNTPSPYSVTPLPDDQEDNHPEIWTIPAHAISACLVITLDAVFSTDRSTLERSDLELVERGLEALGRRRRPSSIVERGTRIVRRLLLQQEQERGPRFRTLDQGEISVLAREIGRTEEEEVGDDRSPRDAQQLGVNRDGDVTTFMGVEEKQQNMADMSEEMYLVDRPENPDVGDDFCMAYLNDPFFQQVFRP